MTTVLTVEFLDPDALRAFENTELTYGRAVVRATDSVELLECVKLRVRFGELSADIPAQVAHPGLPQPDGTVAVGLTVDYDEEARDALHDLLGDPLDRGWHTTQELLPIEVANANEVAARAATGDFSTVEERDSRWLAEEAAASHERPGSGAHHALDRDGITATDWNSAGDDRHDPLADTDVGGAWKQQDESFPDTLTVTGLEDQPPVSGAQPAVLHTPVEGAEVAVAPVVRPRAAETPWDGEATRPTRVLAVDPDRALRANDYFEAARADLVRGQLDLARSNVNLAIAYNPAEREYQRFLLEIESKLAAARV